MQKNDNITKNPVEVGRKGGTNRKGRKNKKTLVKEKVLDWSMAEGLVERNMLEFFNSKNKKERLAATRYFSEFVKPKKRDIVGNVGLTIEDIITEEEDEK